ncbi:MAG: hypothetical protein PHO83_09415 [Geobacteraceae bacterium]|nr:hypothetical protein [Geobacteraceae bacterium]
MLSKENNLNKSTIKCVIDNQLLRSPLLLYAALTLLHIVLVWVLPYFPTQDGPSHIYNLAILHDLINGGESWGTSYTYNLRAVPNLGFLVVSYPLMYFFDPFVVEKLFISIYIILMAVCAPVFIRTFTPSNLPLAFLVFPVIFNYCFMMGFYSFSIAIPCLFLAIASAWTYRNKKFLFRAITLNLTGIVIYYLHLIPFVLFITSLFLISISDSRNFRKIIRNTTLLIAIISPILLLFFYNYCVSKNISSNLIAFDISFNNLLVLLLNLVTFSGYTFSPIQLLPCSFLLFIMYHPMKEFLLNLPGATKSSPGKIFLVLFLIFVIAVYIIMPFGFGGGSYFNQRMIVIIFLLLLPLLKIPEGKFYAKHLVSLLTFITLVFLATNAFVFHQQTRKISEFLSGINVAMPRGSIIATYKSKESNSPPVDPLLHASSYYALAIKGVDVGNYEAITPFFQVRFKPILLPLPETFLLENSPEQINWTQYPSIKYLLGWKIDNNAIQKLERNFKRDISKTSFSLWERIE